MATRWQRFYKKRMREAEMRAEVRAALEELKARAPHAGEAMTIIKEISAFADFKQYGRAGGLKLKRERGPAYYKRIGNLGGRPKGKAKGKRKKEKGGSK